MRQKLMNQVTVLPLVSRRRRAVGPDLIPSYSDATDRHRDLACGSGLAGVGAVEVPVAGGLGGPAVVAAPPPPCAGGLARGGVPRRPRKGGRENAALAPPAPPTTADAGGACGRGATVPRCGRSGGRRGRPGGGGPGERACHPPWRGTRSSANPP